MYRRIITIAILLVFFGIVFNREESEPEEADFVAAFADESFVTTYSKSMITVDCGDEYFDDSEKKEFLSSIYEKIGITGDFGFSTTRNEGTTSTSVVEKGQNWSVTLNFITIEKTGGFNVIYLEQQLFVTIEINDSPESTWYYTDLIRTHLEESGMQAEIKFSLCGQVDKLLTEKEKKNIANRFVNNLCGSIVATDISGDTYAVYGHTKQIEEYVVYGSSKINLSLMIEENSEKGTTTVYMATPSIE